ncbi:MULTISPECIES: DUF5721 family protein [Sellimonas]|uniref:Uncharacterized protein n=1 Tax=Sellimonas caecigallum TaxID=2592333 RepID=A0ABS7L4I8_9FIRM|nr:MULTISPECIES: DUF5721 family protein [Sellimonas]MBY0757959.1 hypothetical protein [Sellimonas caecigallum]OUP01771.1 hypothetical protein B5F37_06055 [Drancourtella sp. An210]OUP65264.1 hypothetical protein B5F13_06295 [Drancourtella sp. An177]
MNSYHMNTKKCMSALLLSDAFDSFSFIEGEITTFCTFQIDGTYHPSFYGDTAETPDERQIRWKQIREYCFSLIKGKQTPLHFRLIFSLPPENIRKLLETEGLPLRPGDVKGLYLNFKYDGTKLVCTTGTSLNLFTMDKSLEHAWDRLVPKYFMKKRLEFEEIL